MKSATPLPSLPGSLVLPSSTLFVCLFGCKLASPPLLSSLLLSHITLVELPALPSQRCRKNCLHLQYPFGSHPPPKLLRKKSPRPSSYLPHSPPAPKSSSRRRPAPGRAANPPRDRRKSPSPRKDNSDAEGEARVMEEVRILKRSDELKLEPNILPRKVRHFDSASAYAGPTFSTAGPSPSSLPFPSFFSKKAYNGTVKGYKAITGSLPILAPAT